MICRRRRQVSSFQSLGGPISHRSSQLPAVFNLHKSLFLPLARHFCLPKRDYSSFLNTFLKISPTVQGTSCSGDLKISKHKLFSYFRQQVGRSQCFFFVTFAKLLAPNKNHAVVHTCRQPQHHNHHIKWVMTGTVVEWVRCCCAYNRAYCVTTN